MQTEIIVAIIGSGSAIAIAAIGWIGGWLIGQDRRRTQRLEEERQKLLDEVRARIALENTICDSEAAKTAVSAITLKIKFRDLCQTKTGLRPSMIPSDIERMNQR